MKRRMLLILAFLFLLSLTGCAASRVVVSEPVETAAARVTEEVETTVATTVPVTVPATGETTAAALEDRDFVNLTDVIPGLAVELRYAGEDNFTGQKIYDFEDAYLRFGTAKKLAAAAAELAEQGLYLKIWDGFRPVEAQFYLWEVWPDPNFVSDPTVGFSSHSRGNTVDLTLVNALGEEAEMPSGFDDFSPLADRDYSGCGDAAAENARLLQDTMERHGFRGYWNEWWHFSDTDTYPVEEEFSPPPVAG